MIKFKGILLSPNPVNASSGLYVEVDVVDQTAFFSYNESGNGYNEGKWEIFDGVSKLFAFDLNDEENGGFDVSIWQAVLWAEMANKTWQDVSTYTWKELEEGGVE